MGWLRMDDGYPRHRKVIALGRGQQARDARILHTDLMCAASREETDGWLDRPLCERTAAEADVSPKRLDRLVSVGLVHTSGHSCGKCPEVPKDMWYLHDFLDLNPSAEERRAKRDANRARQESWRASRNASRNAPQKPKEPPGNASRDTSRTPPTPVPCPPEDNSSSVTSPLLAELRRTDEVLHRSIVLLARQHVKQEAERGYEVRNFDKVVNAEVPKQYEQHIERLTALRSKYPDLTADELASCITGGALPLRYRMKPVEQPEFDPELGKERVAALRSVVGGGG